MQYQDREADPFVKLDELLPKRAVLRLGSRPVRQIGPIIIQESMANQLGAMNELRTPRPWQRLYTFAPRIPPQPLAEYINAHEDIVIPPTFSLPLITSVLKQHITKYSYVDHSNPNVPKGVGSPMGAFNKGQRVFEDLGACKNVVV